MPPRRSPTADAARAPIYRARERTGASGALSRRSIGHRSIGTPYGARPSAPVPDQSASERRRSVPCAAMLDLSTLEAPATPGGATGLQIMLLGDILASLGLLSDGADALASGSIGAWLRQRRSVTTSRRRIGAAVDATLGIGTALAGERR